MPTATTRPAPIEGYRKLFPVVERLSWLNHASQGTLAEPVLNALNQFTYEHAIGEFSGPTEEGLYERVRGVTARFINATPEEIAFTKNVPDGLNIIANGMSWKPGDQVLIPDQEFPANVYPWLGLRELGVETVTVPSRNGIVPLEELLDAITPRTRVVSVSWVEFSTGYRNDLKAIADACHRDGVLFCVDAIQGVGALQFDVQEAGVDVLATSSHKWMLAPTGAGWMYCRRDLIEDFGVKFLGQSSVQRGGPAGYLDYDLPVWDDARKFEPGIHNHLGMIGLEASIRLLTEVGLDRIESRVKELGDMVANGLIERGYEVIGTRAGEQWAGIVSFASKKHAASDIHARLREAGVITALREPRVRVSTHFYNDESDIERFFDALPR